MLRGNMILVVLIWKFHCEGKYHLDGKFDFDGMYGMYLVLRRNINEFLNYCLLLPGLTSWKHCKYQLASAKGLLTCTVL